MAYLRKETKKGKTYLSICENYRNEGGKVQRRVLHSLGNIEAIGAEQLQRIAGKILEAVGKPVAEFEPEEIKRVNFGFAHVIYHVLQQYKLLDVFRRISSSHKLSYALLKPVLLMLCDRINDPLSKLGSFHLQSEYYGLGSISLQHIYRSLGYLDKYNEHIQKHIYSRNRDLFNYELDVVFFDVTTFYFDSDKVQEDSLGQMGFGKDGKIGKTQIVFSLLIDKNKIPIGFEIFEGNKFEGQTFESALDRLKKKYNIGKVVVVADSGMMNKSNIDFFKKGGKAEQYEYIVGERLKNLPVKIKSQITDKSLYTYTLQDDEGGVVKACIVIHDGKTIISTWSAKRAAKDKNEREAKVAKAKALLKNPTLLHKKARHYFIKNAADDKYEIDDKKIKEDEKYDGFKAISTNTTSLALEQILEQYSYLYKIEHSFRTFKSFLEARPMFHWTDQRIRGHLVMCYLSFIVLRYLEEQTKLSENNIRRALDKMQLSLIKSNDQTYWMRSAENENTLLLQLCLMLKKLPSTIKEHTIQTYIPAFL